MIIPLPSVTGKLARQHHQVPVDVLAPEYKQFKDFNPCATVSKETQQICLASWKRVLAGDTQPIQERKGVMPRKFTG